MKLSLEFVAQATSGEILPSANQAGANGANTDNASIDGVSIDSRTIQPNQLFVPIQADSDGHDYIEAAAAAGAAAYLTSQEPQAVGILAVKVADTQVALAELALASRQSQLNSAAVIGITGSVGKTTTKDFCAQVIGAAMVCAASQKSYNNNLGVPLTLLNAPDDCRAVVAEMGTSAVGEIAQLCEIAQPTYGILTSIGMAHMQGFGSQAKLAHEKGELLAALPDDGVAVVNWDNELVMEQARQRLWQGSTGTTGTTITFGLGAGADVSAENIELDDLSRPNFHLNSPWGSAEVRLGIAGEHNVSNALAAASAALHLGVSVEAVAHQLEQAEASAWRMEIRRSKSGILVLNDAYNANPTSVAAALRTLKELKAKRKVAVLGTMAELGDSYETEHRQIAQLAGELGLELVSVAEPAYGTPPLPDHEAVLDRLSDLTPDDAVLLKASRSVGLEKLAEKLLDL